MVNPEGNPLDVSSPPQAIGTLLRPGQMVNWRDPRHAQAIGWLDAYGTGPFEVVSIVDKADLGIPPGVAKPS